MVTCSKIPIKYQTTDEFLVILDLYKKYILSIPRDLEDLKGAYIKEFELQTPRPKIDDIRTRVSPEVSKKYKVERVDSLVQVEGESILDLSSVVKSVMDIPELREPVSDKVKELFSYENHSSMADIDAYFEQGLEYFEGMNNTNTVEVSQETVLSEDQISSMESTGVVSEPEIFNRGIDLSVSTELQISIKDYYVIPITDPIVVSANTESPKAEQPEASRALQIDVNPCVVIDLDVSTPYKFIESVEVSEDDGIYGDLGLDDDEDDNLDDYDDELGLDGDLGLDDDEDDNLDDYDDELGLDDEDSLVDDDYEDDDEDTLEDDYIEEDDEYNDDTLEDDYPEEVQIEEDEVGEISNQVSDATDTKPKQEEENIDSLIDDSMFTTESMDSTSSDDTQETKVESTPEEEAKKIAQSMVTANVSPKESPPPKGEKLEVPKDIRLFLREHPRCPISEVLKYYSKAEINKALMTGRIIKRGDKLHI